MANPRKVWDAFDAGLPSTRDMQEHTLDIESIVAQRHWLRNLARQIARTEADADDLEQGVITVALSYRLDSVRTPRAWLSRVARNLATRTGRSDRARSAREEAIRHVGAAQATDQAVANTEVFALLSRLVLALDEPYRSTLILRFYQDLTPAQIAREMNVPASTVRTRLARSLALLRAKLDERDPGARWMGALAPVALAADGSRRAAFAGGILALCGITAYSVMELSGGGLGGAPPIAPVTDFAPVEDDVEDASVDGETLALGPAPRREVHVVAPDAETTIKPATAIPKDADPPPEIAAPPEGTLVILVTVDGVPHSEGVVILDLAVRNSASGWPDPELRVGGGTPARTHSLDQHGRVQFDGLGEGAWRIATCIADGHSSQRTCELDSGEGKIVQVALTSGTVIGHAYDVAGRPVVDAFVSLSPPIGSSDGQLTKTDAEGAYRIDLAAAGMRYISLHPGATYPNHTNSVGATESIIIPKAGDVVHDFGTRKGLAVVRIKLLTRGGEVPVLKRGLRLHVDGVDSNRYHGDYFSTKNGCEVALPLGEGTWKVQTEHKVDSFRHRLLLKQIDVEFADMTVDAVLPGTRIVVDIGGALDPKTTYVGVSQPGAGPGWVGAHVEGDRWVVDGVGAGEWLLTASAQDGAKAEPVRLTVLESDIELRETLVLPR